MHLDMDAVVVLFQPRSVTRVPGPWARHFGCELDTDVCPEAHSSGKDFTVFLIFPCTTQRRDRRGSATWRPGAVK